MSKIENIESKLERLAEVQDKNLGKITEIVSTIESDTAAVRHRHSSKLTKALAAELLSRRDLHNAIVDSPDEMWLKKKTRTVGRVKFGWRKNRGSMEISDEAMTINKLEKLFPDNSADYIKTKKTIIKTAIMRLSASVLKKCGIEIKADTDEVVVSDATTETAALVAALRKDGLIDIPETK